MQASRSALDQGSYSTFPIVERQEVGAYGSYRSRELCLAHMNALAAGDPDARIVMSNSASKRT
jgi:hypothetical protein